MKNMAQTAVPTECQAVTNSVKGDESALEYMRRKAMVFLRDMARKYRRRAKAEAPKQGIASVPITACFVEAGDRVQVKSLEEIQQTLDERGYTKGCKFMEQMKRYCGQEQRVAGRVEKFFDEARCRTLKCKDIVLLDHIYCDGSVVRGCDRLCFLFWRTEWLRKLD